MIPQYITNSTEILLFMPSHNHRHANTTYGKPDEHYKSVVFLLAFYMKHIFTAEWGFGGPVGGPSVQPDRRTGGSIHPRTEGPKILLS